MAFSFGAAAEAGRRLQLWSRRRGARVWFGAARAPSPFGARQHPPRRHAPGATPAAPAFGARRPHAPAPGPQPHRQRQLSAQPPAAPTPAAPLLVWRRRAPTPAFGAPAAHYAAFGAPAAAAPLGAAATPAPAAGAFSGARGSRDRPAAEASVLAEPRPWRRQGRHVSFGRQRRPRRRSSAGDPRGGARAAAAGFSFGGARRYPGPACPVLRGRPGPAAAAPPSARRPGPRRRPPRRRCRGGFSSGPSSSSGSRAGHGGACCWLARRPRPGPSARHGTRRRLQFWRPAAAAHAAAAATPAAGFSFGGAAPDARRPRAGFDGSAAPAPSAAAPHPQRTSFGAPRRPLPLCRPRRAPLARATRRTGARHRARLPGGTRRRPPRRRRRPAVCGHGPAAAATSARASASRPQQQQRQRQQP